LCEIPSNLKKSISAKLDETLPQRENYKLAVRSSAIGEDSEELSSAGQNETFLGVPGTNTIFKYLVLLTGFFCLLVMILTFDGKYLK
jgi:phosphoenolpyruvate synthase/pyruvate phosphate dikinase